MTRPKTATVDLVHVDIDGHVNTDGRLRIHPTKTQEKVSYKSVISLKLKLCVGR